MNKPELLPCRCGGTGTHYRINEGYDLVKCLECGRILPVDEWQARHQDWLPDYVRYCLDCNHVGRIREEQDGCCPDSHAVYIPLEVARLAELGFEKLYLEPQHTGSCPLCDQRAQLEKDHVLVPRVPTAAMELAGLCSLPKDVIESNLNLSVIPIYSAMIEAAQKEQGHG